ncbi:probable E3 ubiquitin-protein ligase sinah [Aethina tumida]|uniref:probable E3 ubiquitin-protein ligase sinah n=1 Tax=Aethina tumida TaxID=116153 RepID=UPI00096AFFD0|nr:probable E3 ubiquitin-protein ligase sinah [Aethina tumida]XP_049817065.1 probable E3 ubiquitin-protein ligase sinah [Aethina tumida]
MEEMYDELLIELECPICTNYMSPPIRQCVIGHSVCEACRKKLKQCALCQGKFTNARNISLESLAQKMLYPCIYKGSGCITRLLHNEREAHELRCSFKGFQCAMDKCNWSGKLEDLCQHWASKKITSKPYTSCNVCHTKMKNESFYVNMAYAYEKLFWFKCKLINKKLYWAVQFIGNSQEAEEFFYEIEMFKSERTKRKILLSDYCQSIDLDNASLLKEGNCIVINVETIEHLLNDDQTLVYYMRIHPVKKAAANLVSSPMALLSTTTTSYKPRNRSKGPIPNKNQKGKKNKAEYSY